jgi:hypothetical protein
MLLEILGRTSERQHKNLSVSQFSWLLYVAALLVVWFSAAPSGWVVLLFLSVMCGLDVVLMSSDGRGWRASSSPEPVSNI